MPKFLLTFRGPSEPAAPDEDTSSAWMQWFDKIGDSVVEVGDAVGPASRVGNVDGGQRVGGYTIIQAADLNAAAQIAKSSPPVADGYGVEIGQLLEITATMPSASATA